MFHTPITTTANRVLNCARNSGLNGRFTTNRRTIVSSVGFTNDIVHNRRNDTNNPQQQKKLQLQLQLQHHFDAFRSPESARNKPGTIKKNNIQRRSMVTITQTKSSDPAPLFSTHVVDDVSSQSQSETAPTYVLNEDTNLIVTESCLKQIERLLTQRRATAEQPEDFDDGYFLRVFVDAGGCSGFQYQFEVDNELDTDDDDGEDVVVVMAKIDDENNKIVMRPRVVVDETSMGFLEGSTIDYVIEMIKSAFVVSDNPQSESACGCGSSFAMKNFEKFKVDG